MIKRMLMTLSCLATLSSCSSAPELETSYYLFSQPVLYTNSTKAASGEVSKKRAVNLNLTLADYLRQPNIVIQKEDSSLYYAHSHLWAEPLENAVLKALLLDLNDKHKKHTFITSSQNIQLKASFNLQLQIDYFHVNDKSEVILAGNYSLLSDSGTPKVLSKLFYLKDHLAEDGYEHSITKMRGLIKKLSHELIVD